MQTQKIPHPLFKNRFCVSMYGVTIIELIVVLAIIGVLATLVFPSFQQQILISRRGDGINQLLQLKMQQEAYRLEHPTYGSSKKLAMPSSEYYLFSVSDVSATTYTLQAKAIASQTADMDCKLLSVDQSMNKLPANCFSN